MELDHDRAPARSRGQCRVLPDDRDAAGTDDRARRSRRAGRYRLLRLLRVGARGPRPRAFRHRVAQGRRPPRHAPRDRQHRRHPVGPVGPPPLRHTGRRPAAPLGGRRARPPRRAARGDEPRRLPGGQLAAVRPADHPAGRSRGPRPGPPRDRPPGAGRSSAFQVLFPELVDLYEDPDAELPLPGIDFAEYARWRADASRTPRPSAPPATTGWNASRTCRRPRHCRRAGPAVARRTARCASTGASTASPPPSGSASPNGPGKPD